ncbi:MAG: molybdopterin-dependent oxidoreductase [Phycisphaerales bacterium]|nr:molybdopterin-dependent oxidoreductase [Phycisphaerales bacterium]
MPTITINGQRCEFKPGQMILQVANEQGIAVPQYCYHDGLSIVASCRICLAEIWAPNPRNNNQLEAMPKLMPTCQTACGEGMVVYTDSPKAIANQKAVMEYLLINHPLDCPVCDQAGECSLQDYSYEYGRGVSRFEEAKVKQPKKDLGPHVYLYSDRCIMCTRCVRFTREVSGTAELMVEGRGNAEQIDVFPGVALDNELSANVIDLCPVGALLDKDFLFTQRVWFLKETPSIDGLTASGDNIRIDHNDGRVYRVKPRTNMDVNKWWISDEIRYGWKFVDAPERLRTPVHSKFGKRVPCDWTRALHDAAAGLKGKRIALMVSPMLSCEDAFELARAARAIDPGCALAVGPIPRQGADKTFPGGYTVYAEKAPNARGVRRVLEAMGGPVLGYEEFENRLFGLEFAGLIITGNYPSEWASERLVQGCDKKFTVLIDTLPNRLTHRCDVLLPACTWTEKAGCFENARGRIQHFEQAIPARQASKSEAQIGLDLQAVIRGEDPASADELITLPLDAMPGQVPGSVEVARPYAQAYNAAETRRAMAAASPAMAVFLTSVHLPPTERLQEPDMQVVEL